MYLYLTELWKEIQIRLAWTSMPVISIYPSPTKKKKKCHKTWAIVNSYRIKNVVFTLPVIKFAGYMSWCLTQLTILSAKNWNKKPVSGVISTFSKASTLAKRQVFKTHKNARMFFQPPVSEVSGAGDH